MRKKLIILLILAGIAWLGFYFIPPNFKGVAQISTPITVPHTLQEIEAAGIRALKLIPEFLKGIWRALLDFLQDIWEGAKTIWNSYIYRFFRSFWLFISSLIEEKKLIIVKEFEKEKEAVKEDVKAQLRKITESLLEKFKGFIR